MSEYSDKNSNPSLIGTYSEPDVNYPLNANSVGIASVIIPHNHDLNNTRIFNQELNNSLTFNQELNDNTSNDMSSTVPSYNIDCEIFSHYCYCN